MDTHLLDMAVSIARKRFNLVEDWELINCTMKASDIKLKMSNTLLEIDIKIPVSLVQGVTINEDIEKEEMEIREVSDLEVDLKGLDLETLKSICEDFEISYGPKSSSKALIKRIMSKKELHEDIKKRLIK